jgi:hypothetical protein
MTSFPVPLDNLIAYVRAQQPDGGPLDNLADAMAVSAALDEQADALLGYFVDQARRAGESWTRIGEHMGVSKQAARKRFIPRYDGSDPVPEAELFSRFTQRCRNALVAAGRLAERSGATEIDAAHVVVGLLSEPDGLAAAVLHDAGLTNQQIGGAFGLDPDVPHLQATAADLAQLRFAEQGNTVLRGTLEATLRLGHNFVGTEHLLLGVLYADGPAAATLTSLGLDAQHVERAVREQIAQVQQRRQAG